MEWNAGVKKIYGEKEMVQTNSDKDKYGDEGKEEEESKEK